jgi:hypothetical protein
MKDIDKLEADFRELVLFAVNTGRYDSQYPWGSFVKVFNPFRKKKGLPHKLTQGQYNFWTEVYLDVLDKAKIEIDERKSFVRSIRARQRAQRAKRKKSIVSSVMKRDAWKHQKFHDVRTD